MWRWMAAALLMGTLAPVSHADAAPDKAALRSAMKSFYVVVPADSSGKPVAEVRANADGTDQRTVVVAFIDAADAAAEMAKANLATRVEGRLVNGADVVALVGSDVIWRTSEANAGIVNTKATTPPVFYITNAEGKSLTKVIDGQEKVLFYLDAVAADEARVAAQNGLSALGQPSTLSIVAADFAGLIDGVQSGKVKNAYFVSAPTTVRWADQWDAGKRLIKDFKRAAP